MRCLLSAGSHLVQHQILRQLLDRRLPHHETTLLCLGADGQLHGATEVPPGREQEREHEYPHLRSLLYLHDHADIDSYRPLAGLETEATGSVPESGHEPV